MEDVIVDKMRYWMYVGANKYSMLFVDCYRRKRTRFKNVDVSVSWEDRNLSVMDG
jgi:hypothetical protein